VKISTHSFNVIDSETLDRELRRACLRFSFCTISIGYAIKRCDKLQRENIITIFNITLFSLDYVTRHRRIVMFYSNLWRNKIW